MSSSSDEDDQLDFFEGETLPIFTMSQQSGQSSPRKDSLGKNQPVRSSAERPTTNPTPAAKPVGKPVPKADEKMPAKPATSAQLSTSKNPQPSTSKAPPRNSPIQEEPVDKTMSRVSGRTSSIVTRPSGMESETSRLIREAMMEGVSAQSVPSGSRYTSTHSRGTAGSHSTRVSHIASHNSGAFSKPLHVRDALVRGRIRRASVGYQSFGLGHGGHPLLHETPHSEDRIQEEDDEEAEGSEATGTTTTTLSDSTPLSSTFIKCHSKGSIRKERKKHHLVHKMMKHKGEMHTIMFKFCESKTFNSFLLSIILLNTLSLGAQTWETVQVRMGWYLDAMDNVFLGIYFMEAVVKIYVWRKLYFDDSWNILDFTILVFNIVDYLLPIVVQNVQGFDGATIFRMLRILRGIRAIRAFRVLRTIKFLSNLTVIMNTCLQSVQSMGAIVMLMTLFMYMFAVIGRGLYAKKDPERFGSLTSTAFTLFQLLTLDEWFDIYSDMVEKSPESWTIIIYLLLYIVLEYFVFLNLFVAVLVDNFQLTLEAANEAKKAKKKVLVDSDDEEDRLEVSDDGSSDITGSSEISVRPPRQTIDEVYPKYTEFSQDHLNYYFQLLAALEYNSQVIFGQKKTLDMLVDLCIETNDDADQ